MEVVIAGLEKEGTARQEVRALVGALLELGLAELPEVVPVVEGAPRAPGLADTPDLRPVRQRALVELAEVASAVQLQVTLCPDGAGACSRHLAAAPSVEALPETVAGLLSKLAGELGRRPGPALEATWRQPPSRDSYALYLTGRSAATVYGWRPPLAEADVGDRRRDATVRALFIDPTNPLAWWLSGRQHLLHDAPEKARAALRRAVELRPAARLMRADEAAALSRLEVPELALEAWEALRQRTPEDLRFALPHARALLAAGQPASAEKVLDRLPAALQETVPLLRLRAGLADAGHPVPDLDALLERWQQGAPGDPEPVRRRIRVRIRSGAYAEALPLTEELEARGATEEARALALSLAVAVKSWELAAAKAMETHQTQVAARIEARAALEANPAEVPVALAGGVTEPMSLVARGSAHLAAGAGARALQDAERALAARPHFPEALALKASALRQLGREKEAQAAEAQLKRTDPDWPMGPSLGSPEGPRAQGPSTAPGSTTSGLQLHAASP